MTSMIEAALVGNRNTTLYLNVEAIESLRSVEGVKGTQVKMRSGENLMIEGTITDILQKMAAAQAR